MSRFGIRKKLKGLFGNAPEKIPEYSVTYILPNGQEHVVVAEERYSLLMASQSLPSSIGTGRRAGGTCPDGYCGLCRVEIEDPTGISPMKDVEIKALEDHVAGTEHEGRPRKPGPPLTPNTRLACHARIIGDGGRVRVASLVDYDALRGD